MRDRKAEAPNTPHRVEDFKSQLAFMEPPS